MSKIALNSSLTIGRGMRCLIVALSAAWLCTAQATPTLLSVTPANMATGVPTTTSVVFTFSEAMDPDDTISYATLSAFTPPMTFADCPVTSAWSAGNTVLTCTPVSALPAVTMIFWEVTAANPSGDSVEGETSGMFTTGSGGGGGSTYGTNQWTSFAVGKIHYYNQSNSVAPQLDLDSPYVFTASASMASNRPVSSVQFLLPTGLQTNLNQNFIANEDFYLVDSATNLTAFNTQYPVGNYKFTVKSSAADLAVTVALLAENQQPNAPKVTNFDALQAADPASPVTISWAPFDGGAAKDFIHVQVWKMSGINQTNAFSTGEYGETNALTGTATSVQIPVGRLEPNTEYSLDVLFTRTSYTTNQANVYTAGSYRGTLTSTSLKTGSGSSGGSVSIGNVGFDSGAIVFDVTSPAGKTVTVEYATSLPGTPWLPLISTNSASGKVQIKDPVPKTPGGRFYRAKI